MGTAARMSLVAALEVLRDSRRDEIVITSMGSAREWPALPRHPLDLCYVPSAMGQAPLLGLGIALAQPAREVVVCSGDGSLLMNLGCLVTIANAAAQNFTLLLFDNGVYEVTGGQRTAGGMLEATGQGAVDWIGLARASGLDQAWQFDELASWRAHCRASLDQPGPRFIALRVAPSTGDTSLESPGPMAPRLAAFRSAIGQ